MTQLRVRPEHVDLVDGSGSVIGELSYDDEVETFVAVMSSVLGGPPDVEERPGGHEWHPWTLYTWPGVEVIDDHEPPGYSSDMNVSVRFTRPTVGSGVAVSTIQGFRPGDDLQAFAAQLGATWHGNGYDEFPAETGPEIDPRTRGPDPAAEYANAYAVSVNLWGAAADPSATSVIFAPWNFGIGHV